MLLDESAVLSDPALWPTQKAFDQLGGSGRLKVVDPQDASWRVAYSLPAMLLGLLSTRRRLEE